MIYLGADHGGFRLKERIKDWLSEINLEFEDLGAFEENKEDDYPDFIIPVAKKVAENRENLGIVLGRSGNGEAICANKIKEIRAAICLNVEMARKAREHNNANILSIGADYIAEDEVKGVVKTFLETPFSGDERHLRRLGKIRELEN